MSKQQCCGNCKKSELRLEGEEDAPGDKPLWYYDPEWFCLYRKSQVNPLWGETCEDYKEKDGEIS